MPKIEQFLPGGIPDHLKAPHFADAGGAISESALNTGQQLAGDATRTQGLVNSTIGEVGGAAIQTLGNLAAAQQKVNAVTKAKQALINVSNTSTLLNKAKQETQDYISKYDQQSVGNPTAYNDENKAKFLSTFDDTYKKYRTQVDALNDPTGQSVKTFDTEWNNFKTSGNEHFLKTGVGVQETQAKINDSTNYQIAVSNLDGSPEGLAKALKSYDDPNSIKARYIAGVTPEKFYSDRENLIKQNADAGYIQVQNATPFIQASNGNFVGGAKSQLQAVATKLQQLDTDPNYKALNPRDKEAYISKYQSLHQAVESQLKTEIQHANFSTSIQVSDLKQAITSSNNPIDRLNVQNQLRNLRKAEAAKPVDEQDHALIDEINSAIEAGTATQLSRELNSATTTSQNIAAQATQAQREENQVAHSQPSTDLQNSINNRFIDFSNRIKFAQSLPTNKGKPVIEGTKINVHDLKQLHQDIETAYSKGYVDQTKYLAYKKALETTRTQLIPTSLQEGRKFTPQAWWDANRYIHPPLDSFLKLYGAEQGSKEALAVGNRVTNMMVGIKNNPANAKFNLDGDTLQNMAMRAVLRQDLYVQPGTAPKKTLPAIQQHKSIDQTIKNILVPPPPPYTPKIIKDGKYAQ